MVKKSEFPLNAIEEWNGAQYISKHLIVYSLVRMIIVTIKLYYWVSAQ